MSVSLPEDEWIKYVQPKASYDDPNCLSATMCMCAILMGDRGLEEFTEDQLMAEVIDLCGPTAPDHLQKFRDYLPKMHPEITKLPNGLYKLLGMPLT